MSVDTQLLCVSPVVSDPSSCERRRWGDGNENPYHTRGPLDYSKARPLKVQHESPFSALLVVRAKTSTMSQASAAWIGSRHCCGGQSKTECLFVNQAPHVTRSSSWFTLDFGGNETRMHPGRTAPPRGRITLLYSRERASSGVVGIIWLSVCPQTYVYVTTKGLFGLNSDHLLCSLSPENRAMVTLRDKVYVPSVLRA